MKYANQLTDDELKDLYLLFTDSDAKVNELNITRDDDSICLKGYIEIPEWEEDRPKAVVILDDDYEITDYDVTAYHHSGDCTLEYRKWMYQKFGDAYARDYLLS